MSVRRLEVGEREADGAAAGRSAPRSAESCPEAEALEAEGLRGILPRRISTTRCLIEGGR